MCRICPESTYCTQQIHRRQSNYTSGLPSRVYHMTRFNAGTCAEPAAGPLWRPIQEFCKSIHLCDGHDNTVRLARVDRLARLLDLL